MISIQLPFSLNSKKLNKMKFWQTKKKLDISETVQVYKVIYLGNLSTTWAKGENTLEKPLTALWHNYCNNYVDLYSKNINKKLPQVKNKQIVMKLTICNQGLKGVTKEFGLTQYWANRITFCGQNSNFPHVFAWIYRHEGKRMKQELRVHACLVNKQVNVSKLINTLQLKLNFALNEFKREKKIRENSRKIMYINNNINLDEISKDQSENDSDIFVDFVDYENSKMMKDDEYSLNLSENKFYDKNSINSSKNSTLDSKKNSKNCSRNSLNSFVSKSSNCSAKSLNYNENLLPLRKQFLIKGMRNFKEPLERSKSAPKLSSIIEEFSSEEESEEEIDEDEDFYNNLMHKNIKDYFNSCEEENYNEIFCELKLLNGDVSPESNKENKHNLIFEDNQIINLSPEPNLPKIEEKEELDLSLVNSSSNVQLINNLPVNNFDLTQIENDIKCLKLNQNNEASKNDNSLNVYNVPQFILVEKKLLKNNSNSLDYKICKNCLNDKLYDENEISCKINQVEVKNISSFERGLKKKKVLEDCKLIENLVLNF